jgi:hypothetical protein
MVFGAGLIGLGVILLLGSIFQVNLWRFFWPAALVLLGLWLLIRPRLVHTGGASIILLGDVRRNAQWPVENEEFWVGIGDVKLDMSQADIPLGETTLRAYGFIGDVGVIVPPEVGVEVSCVGFVSTAKVFGVKRESFVMPITLASQNYAAATRKIRIDGAFFIGDIKARQNLPVAEPQT